jgi:hypothetical protein
LELPPPLEPSPQKLRQWEELTVTNITKTSIPELLKEIEKLDKIKEYIAKKHNVT